MYYHKFIIIRHTVTLVSSNITTDMQNSAFFTKRNVKLSIKMSNRKFTTVKTWVRHTADTVSESLDTPKQKNKIS
jgi:hypothetical protein